MCENSKGIHNSTVEHFIMPQNQKMLKITGRIIQCTLTSTVGLTVEASVTQGLQNMYGSKEWVQGGRIKL